MNKTVSFYLSVIFLSFTCNLNNAFSEEPISLPVNFKGKYTSDIKNYEIVVPQRVNKDGSFISHLVSHHHSKRSTKELEFIFYKIPIGGKDYLIELTPNRKLISPGAVVEIHKENVRKSENRKFLNESSNNEKIGDMFKNLDIRKLENTQCHFSGTVKGENTSKAALSTCYGLAGFIQTARGFYTIEPVAEHDPFVEDAYPHILYKTDGLENSSVCHTMGQLTASLVDQLVRKRRESTAGLSSPLYVETLIVLDKSMINHHRDSDCENYVLTVFNMAFNLFHDASSGLMMTLTIVRIIRLEIENDEMNLKVNADAEKTLRYFQNWQYEINPGDDSHPNHHDVAVLITRVNVCYSPTSCGLLGLTTIGKACDPKLSAALCEDSGLRLGYVIAHEIGHLLGAEHDSVNSTCNGTDANGLKTVMHPHVSMIAQTWSKCSRAYFRAFFGSGMGSCFLDEPEEHHFNVQDLLPGVMYNANFQCKHFIAMNARECDMGSTCDSLNCYVPGYACIVTHTPPAAGTHCGENMWCHETKCLVVGERPGAVDGNWGEWSAWSDCSRSCGSGVASSMRNCDKPQPSHGGKNCVGERKRHKICAATVIFRISDVLDLIRFISEEVNVSFVGKPCETGRPSFRDIQCGEFNDWIYPEDGKVHTWKAYFYHDDNPCTLYCVNEEKQIAALRPRVVDGTMCFRGIRDVCVSGICKNLPCDLHFESNAVEDACGVCHGDGTGCEFSEGKETFSKLTRGLTKLVNIPSGAKNIKVEELSPTLARIIVRDKDTREIYIRGKSLGMFNVPGSQAWLGMIKKNQEALNIPGPVTKPLSVWIQRLENVTVKWSMALPAEQQRKPEFAWDFLRWGPCSAICGPGTQISKPSCMEGKAGLVEDTFCADLEMPPTKVRQCEITKCEPRWMVGDWKGCEQPTSKEKKRRRIVYCIKSIGEGEGESEIVPDSLCLGPKPHEEEPCENRQKREDSEYSYFEIDSKFRHSDTSEFGFHKKYDDYLKHFAALSVPQRNSETIPLHLVSSPHFKQYFHVLETSDDSETDSGSEESSPNGTSYDVQAQDRVVPDFYKDTFSGQQIDVSHIQAEGATASENRTKKSATRGNSGTVNSWGVKKFYKTTSKSKRDGKSKRKYLKFPSSRRGDRTGYGNDRKNSRKSTRNIWNKLLLRQECKKNFTYGSPNLLTVVENLNENYKSLFSDLIIKGGPEKLSSLEKKKLRNSQLNAFKPKLSLLKQNGFFSLFTKNRQKPSKQYEVRKSLRTYNKDFDGSGLRLRSPVKFGKIREEMKTWGMKEEKKFHANSDPQGGDTGLRKGVKETQAVLEGSSSPRNKRKQREKKLPNRFRKSSRGRVHKRKRSSRIWKKPKSKDGVSKSGREQYGNACGTETKNYLNNLFRENHPKVSNVKPAVTKEPQKTKHNLELPVIKQGVLVIDKDSAENQEMDIFFEDDEAEEKRKKYVKLPRPEKNERKLTIKGQDVFNLIHELQQRSGREAFYRPQGDSAKIVNHATEVALSKPTTASVTPHTSTSVLPQGENSTTSEETTSSAKATTHSENLESKQTAKEETTRSQNSTTEAQKETTTPTTAAHNTTTEGYATTKEADNSGGCDEDIDDSVEDPTTTEETTKTKKKGKKGRTKSEKKKKKKKKKGKEKKTDSENILSADDFPEGRFARRSDAKEVVQKHGRRKINRCYHDGL